MEAGEVFRWALIAKWFGAGGECLIVHKHNGERLEGGEANVLLLELVLDLLGKGDVYLWGPAAPPTKLTPICQANISISGDLSKCVCVLQPAFTCCGEACLP